MRILLDENIPIDFAAELRGHDVSTVAGLGWSGVLNGELMLRAAESCDVFVTSAILADVDAAGPGQLHKVGACHFIFILE